MMLSKTMSAAILTVVVSTGALAQTAAPVTDPVEFAMMAASGNKFEIQSSELALLNIESGQEVALFAQQMLTDHTAAGEKMTSAAEEDGVPVPEAMSEKHQDMMKQLQSAEGNAFTDRYVEEQLAAHEEAVALFSSFSTNGEESALKAFAAETLPTLEMHHAHVKELASR